LNTRQGISSQKLNRQALDDFLRKMRTTSSIKRTAAAVKRVTVIRNSR